jgi:flagellar biosynthesis/type III secretory pathway M-ring protein FliF/YscJ
VQIRRSLGTSGSDENDRDRNARVKAELEQSLDEKALLHKKIRRLWWAAAIGLVALLTITVFSYQMLLNERQRASEAMAQVDNAKLQVEKARLQAENAMLQAEKARQEAEKLKQATKKK